MSMNSWTNRRLQSVFAGRRSRRAAHGLRSTERRSGNSRSDEGRNPGRDGSGEGLGRSDDRAEGAQGEVRRLCR